MKVVILAGGLGSRLSEETQTRPKPMVEIGGHPILWHIMKIYAHHGLTDFIVCLGYKGYVIKEYFANYFLHNHDVTLDLSNNGMTLHQGTCEPWKVTLADTGVDSMTGGRLRAIGKYLDDEDFCFTYGDGVSDVDITDLLRFHKAHGKLATVTAVLPQGRFGAMEMNGNAVAGFQEKPRGDGGLINGGFFVLSPKVLPLIDGPATIWEQEPMQRLVEANELQAYRHDGFWHAMDTLRDRNALDGLLANKEAPWVKW